MMQAERNRRAGGFVPQTRSTTAGVRAHEKLVRDPPTEAMACQDSACIRPPENGSGLPVKRIITSRSCAEACSDTTQRARPSSPGAVNQ